MALRCLDDSDGDDAWQDEPSPQRNAPFLPLLQDVDEEPPTATCSLLDAQGPCEGPQGSSGLRAAAAQSPRRAAPPGPVGLQLPSDGGPSPSRGAFRRAEPCGGRPHEGSATSAPPAKRRRLCGKQARPAAFRRTTAQVLHTVQWWLSRDKQGPSALLAASGFDKRRLHDALRYEHAKVLKLEARRQRGNAAKGQALADVTRQATKSFPSLDARARAALVQRVVERPETTTAQRYALLEYRDELLTEPSAGKKGGSRDNSSQRLAATAVLLTWQGPWGVLDDNTPEGHGGDLDSLVRALRKHPACPFLWQTLQDRAKRWHQDLSLQRWAVCIELCQQTWLEKGQVRLHVHGFFQRQSKLRLRSLQAQTLGGSQPHRSDEGSHTRARGRAASAAYAAGLYYIQCEKVGQVFAAGNKRPFVDYVVQAEWITAYWQTDKLSDQAAREAYVLQKKDVERHVSNLDRQVRWREQLRLEKVVAAAAASLDAEQRPQRHVPAVAKWLLEQARPQLRQRFLVLDGPSRTGKTLYCTALRGRRLTVDVNCAGVTTEPDLRSFRPGHHAALLFDEASAQMVLRNKKLFQAPVASVQMAQSSTNCHSYAVNVHQVLLMVCSNRWQKELDELCPEDRGWLEQNQIYVQVTEPLWE